MSDILPARDEAGNQKEIRVTERAQGAYDGKREKGLILLSGVALMRFIPLWVKVSVFGVFPLIVSIGYLLQPQGSSMEGHVRHEIALLDWAIRVFQEEYHISYPPPSRLRLREKGGYDVNDPLDRETVKILNAMFPKVDLTKPINWKGYGTPSDDWILEGDQCLVFFLGGIPEKNGSRSIRLWGFAADPLDPTNFQGEWHAPLYEFDQSRLVLLPRSPFPVYCDRWRTRAFAYFSTFDQPNNYYRHADRFGSDCARLGVWPYAESLSPLKCVNPDTFQIISAGGDCVFGPGTNPKTGEELWHPRKTREPPGRDDLHNFSIKLPRRRLS
jgi:hypothetical protein